MGSLAPNNTPTIVRRLSGQLSTAPSGVLAQSCDRISAPVSPPSINTEGDRMRDDRGSVDGGSVGFMKTCFCYPQFNIDLA